MLMSYARFEKTSLLSDLLPPESQTKDQIRLRTQNRDYLNHIAEAECVNQGVSRSSLVIFKVSKRKPHIL